MDLELAAAVDQVDERGAAVTAAGAQAAGDAVRDVGLLTGLEFAVGGDDLGNRRDATELVRERVDALLAQAVELRPPVVLRRGSGLGLPLHGREATARSW